MLEKLLPWIGGIFATVGLICLLFDLVNSIRKRNRRALNIASLIVLSISIIGYLLTDVIIKDSVWPAEASFVWIALFWVYVILTAVATLNDVKEYKRNRPDKQDRKTKLKAEKEAKNINK